jgi:hypothetical protein
MPYIKKFKRKSLDKNIILPSNPGELNYIFSQISVKYINNKGEKYQTYNDIVGALECCKLEIYRKLLAKYEDNKEFDNGTVWDLKKGE